MNGVLKVMNLLTQLSTMGKNLDIHICMCMWLFRERWHVNKSCELIQRRNLFKERTIKNRYRTLTASQTTSRIKRLRLDNWIPCWWLSQLLFWEYWEFSIYLSILLLSKYCQNEWAWKNIWWPVWFWCSATAHLFGKSIVEERLLTTFEDKEGDIMKGTMKQINIYRRKEENCPHAFTPHISSG